MRSRKRASGWDKLPNLNIKVHPESTQNSICFVCLFFPIITRRVTGQSFVCRMVWFTLVWFLVFTWAPSVLVTLHRWLFAVLVTLHRWMH